jgi:ribosomal protein S27E
MWKLALWKLALADAAQTWHKYRHALFVEVRQKIARRSDFDEHAQHYAYGLLSGYPQFFGRLEGGVPEPKLKIEAASRNKVAAFVRRLIGNLRGKQPCVTKVRRFVLDADCHKTFVQSNAQYACVMTLECGKRVVSPLRGHAAISGNIRVVIDGAKVEVHVPQTLTAKVLTGEIAAVDFGYTEAVVATKGNAYGDGLGAIMTAASNERNIKGKARSKRRALAQKRSAGGSVKDPQKGRNIGRFNLDKIKCNRRKDKAQPLPCARAFSS